MTAGSTFWRDSNSVYFGEVGFCVFVCGGRLCVYLPDGSLAFEFVFLFLCVGLHAVDYLGVIVADGLFGLEVKRGICICSDVPIFATSDLLRTVSCWPETIIVSVASVVLISKAPSGMALKNAV